MRLVAAATTDVGIVGAPLMKQKTARWLRRAADWLDPPQRLSAPAPEIVAAPLAIEPGPQVLLVRRALAAEYLRRALHRYSPEREYRA
jgi:hypothetical protein